MWVYIGTATVLLLVVAYTTYRRVAGRLWIATQAMVIFWCLGYALQISGADIKTAAFWYLASNDFVGFKVPVIWLLWALRVAGKKNLFTRRQPSLLLIIPIITDILNLTNSYHGLIYRQMWLDMSGEYPLLYFICGPWYWIITAYCSILLLAVIAVQVKAALNRELLHPIQGFTIAATTAAVLIFIFLSIFTQGSMFAYYDLTPVVIGIAAVLTGLAFSFQAQEAVPVPRNAVMEKMTSAVLILDDHNRIMDLNSAAEAFFGLRSSKAAGLVFEKALPSWSELTAAIRDKSVSYCEFSRNGRHYEAYFSGLSDGCKAAGYIVVVQDITVNKAVEAQVIEQQRALLVLQERERLARELHDSLGQVLGYTNIQIQTMRDMLKAGQFEAIGRSLDCLSQVIMEANTEVREFIYEVKTTLFFKEGFFAALQQYLIHFEHNFQIQVDMKNPDNLTENELDLPAKVQLFRIIKEALNNVRKHAQASKATVSFEKKDRQILISVADDGVGFDPEKLTTGEFSFGLEVMRERTQQISGEIRINTALGHGTTVIVSIPDFADRCGGAEVEGLGVDAAVKHAKIRVLLADDHVLFIEGLQTLIGSKGFEVVGTARDGMEALEKARLLHPEMILMDLQMPRCNGLIATRLIKAEIPEIKIVILTMSDQELDLLTAIQNGASGYLLKGLRTEEFIDQLYSLASNTAIISPELATHILDELIRNENDILEEAASSTVDPEKYLSKRQIEILTLIAKEYKYKEVASKLFISERTVKYQMAEILRILQLQNRRQAIAYARKAGLGKEPDLGNER
nr:histidine kinase N-terminal 7TM domain-containing protein [Oxobacter pfennigii]